MDMDLLILGGVGAFILALIALFAWNGAFAGLFSRDGEADDGSYNYAATSIGLHATDSLYDGTDDESDDSGSDGDSGDSGSGGD